MKHLTRLLTTLTMYRLMLYFLCILVGAVVILSAFNVLPYDPAEILLQAVFLIAVAWGANWLLAKAIRTEPNPESSVITGLILACIMGPFAFAAGWSTLGITALAAVASKYALAWRKSHVFNPAATGALVAGLALGEGASWWIGSAATFPLVLLGGLIVARRIRRFHLIEAFLFAYVGLTTLDMVFFGGRGAVEVARAIVSLFTSTSILFFAFVMLVEPLTSPQTARNRIWFGAVVGVALFVFQRLTESVLYPLEISLLIGNLFGRIVSPDARQSLRLKAKEMFSQTIGGFWFEPTHPFSFRPGQFLEYTLSHLRPDSRGIRRYFTIASSPTEKAILITTRFADPGSTFKIALRGMRIGSEIIASKVSGDFILPSDPSAKLVFIAGGIGVTPFRSMTKYLLDSGEARDIILIYAARTAGDLVFRDMFEAARDQFGLKIIPVIADAASAASLSGSKVSAVVNEGVIRDFVPDLDSRIFYVSGPEPMVEAIEKTLAAMGIPDVRMKRDYFPGYDTH